MVYIADKEEDRNSHQITKHSISVSGITLTLSGLGNLEIETDKKWSGSVENLLDLLSEVMTQQQENGGESCL